MGLLKPELLPFFRSCPLLCFVRNLGNSSNSYSQYWNLIEHYTVQSDQHLTPEIKLRLITRQCLAWNQPITENSPHPLGEPFWAFYWPGGQALSRYILDNPLITKGKHVLDFGCGSGALAIAAVKSGAKSATANDIDHVSIAASQLNAQINGVKLKVNQDNLVGSKCAEYDVILVGDMLYDTAISHATVAWLMKLRAAKKTILIGDPGRGPVSDSTISSSLRYMAKYELDSITKEDNYGFY